MNNEEDYELTLFDRVEMTKKLVEKAGGASKVCVSFSGGKDSSVLSKLIDLALPGNSIPRVFSDTGMEFQSVRRSVEEKAREDRRIMIVRPGKPIVRTLEEVGFPMKSKLHAHMLGIFQRLGYTRGVMRYTGMKDGYRSTNYRCPKKLLGQFEPGAVPFKVSEHCCREFKKKPMDEARKRIGRPVFISGDRREEHGIRAQKGGCFVSNRDYTKLSPLYPVSEEFVDWMVAKFRIPLPDVYGSPCNMRRTGCKGCPFDLFLQKDLDIMERYLPNDFRMANAIFGRVYEEYRKRDYRLDRRDADGLLF